MKSTRVFGEIPLTGMGGARHRDEGIPVVISAGADRSAPNFYLVGVLREKGLKLTKESSLRGKPEPCDQRLLPGHKRPLCSLVMS